MKKIFFQMLKLESH